MVKVTQNLWKESYDNIFCSDFLGSSWLWGSNSCLPSGHPGFKSCRWKGFFQIGVISIYHSVALIQTLCTMDVKLRVWKILSSLNHAWQLFYFIKHTHIFVSPEKYLRTLVVDKVFYRNFHSKLIAPSK